LANAREWNCTRLLHFIKNLVDATGRFAASVGVPALAGPFILAAAAFMLAGLVLLVFLRPDPLVVARAIAEAQKTDQSNLSEKNSNTLATNNRGIIVGVTVMILTQMVMVAIMTMTPIHMMHHGHSLGGVGLVISIHICAMFLPSLLTGILVDKVGRIAISFVSGVILLIACILAVFVPAESMLLLIIVLALLGIGWNLGLISGTALIVDATHPATRAGTQGNVDVLIALAGASGGALSGMVVAHSSYATLSLAGGILSLLLIPVVIWFRSSRKIVIHENM
jgi:predicted MFS family arabinose efflux permease